MNNSVKTPKLHLQRETPADTSASGKKAVLETIVKTTACGQPVLNFTKIAIRDDSGREGWHIRSRIVITYGRHEKGRQTGSQLPSRKSRPPQLDCSPG
ncbi:hypothetical protein VTO42DRAFT_5917 [Malbranchea cinnamomea]